MLYLGIDPGDRRTGLAVGDSDTGIVSPVGVVETRDAAQRVALIVQAAVEHGVDALVVGLPLNMDGTTGPAAQKAEALAAQLRGTCGKDVHLHDERLSSFAADGQMAQSGLTHKQKKERRDALAAAVMLKDYLTTREER